MTVDPHSTYGAESCLRLGVLDKLYMIKFISDLRQVGGFLRFPPPIKFTVTI